MLDEPTPEAAPESTPEAAASAVSDGPTGSPPGQSTGDPAIDEALAELRRVGDGTLRDRLEAGERVHAVLHARLNDTDEG